MKKVHLGCWHRYIPGFVHVDICNFPHIDYQSTVDRLPFFEDESIDLIYASHVLSYFDREEAFAVLNEWKRVLKQGGTLRLAVPNFSSLIKVISVTGDINNILGPLYGKMSIQTSSGLQTLYHKTAYDEKQLVALLLNVGFCDIKPWDWRDTEHAAVDDHSQAYHPHMEKETGLLVSLNIQAQKIT